MVTEMNWLAFAGILFLILLILVVAVFLFAFWIMMLIDSIKRKYKEENMKIVWVLVIIFAGLIGALIYYFVEKRKDKKRK